MRITDSILGAADYLPTPLAWRSWRATKAGRAFDRRYGTDTQSHVDIAALGLDRGAAEHAVAYEPSAIPKVKCALRHLGVRAEEFDFIDVGSGKGIVPLLAARYPFRRVVGVEASLELHGIAERNLTLYRTRGDLRAPVQFVNVDALNYDFDESNQVVYLYNPFDGVVLRSLMGRLLGTVAPARLVVVYVNPIHRDVIEASGAFRAQFDNGSLVVLHHRPSGRRGAAAIE